MARSNPRRGGRASRSGSETDRPRRKSVTSGTHVRGVQAAWPGAISTTSSQPGPWTVGPSRPRNRIEMLEGGSEVGVLSGEVDERHRPWSGSRRPSGRSRAQDRGRQLRRQRAGRGARLPRSRLRGSRTPCKAAPTSRPADSKSHRMRARRRRRASASPPAGSGPRHRPWPPTAPSPDRPPAARRGCRGGSGRSRPAGGPCGSRSSASRSYSSVLGCSTSVTYPPSSAIQSSASGSRRCSSRRCGARRRPLVTAPEPAQRRAGKVRVVAARADRQRDRRAFTGPTIDERVPRTRLRTGSSRTTDRTGPSGRLSKRSCWRAIQRCSSGVGRVR